MTYGRDPHGGIPLFQNQRFFLQALDVVDEFGVTVVDIRKLLRESVDFLIDRVVVGVQLFFAAFEVVASCPGALRDPSAIQFRFLFSQRCFLFELSGQVGCIGQDQAHLFSALYDVFTIAHVLVIC